ncbi:MAG TPA: hypothetical protein DIW81_12230, partial [Planctomycetaceae bacterium]|nr:hypothetical protein [Planctomycetaceae bacterium]
MKNLLLSGLILFALSSSKDVHAQGPSPFDEYNQPQTQQPYQQQSPNPYQQPPTQDYRQMPQRAPMPTYQLPPPSVRDFSLIYIDEPPPKEYMINDIVTVIVSERSEVTLNSRFNRQRTSTFKSELKDFVRLGDGLRLENSATTSPAIDASQQERLQTTGQVTDAA